MFAPNLASLARFVLYLFYSRQAFNGHNMAQNQTIVVSSKERTERKMINRRSSTLRSIYGTVKGITGITKADSHEDHYTAPQPGPTRSSVFEATSTSQDLPLVLEPVLNVACSIDTGVQLESPSTTNNRHGSSGISEEVLNDSTNVFSPDGIVSTQEAMDFDQLSTNATAGAQPSDVADGRPADDAHELPMIQKEVLDIAESIHGMYRILDLVSEHGSGGLGKSFMT